MCCCPSPNVNGTPNAYSWDGIRTSTRPVDAPSIALVSETVILDEPGRCGNGVGDCHSHHFTVVKQQYGGLVLLVRHGGGDERIALGYRCALIDLIEPLGTHERYKALHSIYNVASTAAKAARDKTLHTWQQAAAEGRIKTRKQRGSNTVKVWIE